MAIEREGRPELAAGGAAPAHPLDPLRATEIDRAVRVLKREKGLGPSIRFETVELKEPPKAVVRGFRPGQPIARRAFVCMFDVESNGVFEAEVDLEAGSVAAWREVPGARPTIMPEELSAVEACVEADPAFAEACARRGIAVEQAQVDAWSAGNYGLADEAEVRVAHTFVWLKKHAFDNGYAHPVEGLNVVVDINRLKVLRIDDHGGPPAPMAEHNYASRFLGQPTAYRLIPHGATPVFTHPDALVMKRAGFIGHHLWVTPFDQNQRFPAGRYVKQPGVATGFTLQPAGFFDRNPALDVPPASSRASREAACSGCEA